MVEPVTLGAVVAALAAKALERAEGGVVDGGAGILRRLFDTLRERFSRAGDDGGTTALDRLAEAPDSPSRMRDLAALVDERSNASSELRRELEALVEEARSAGIDIDSISQVAIGKQNVQIAGSVNSDVSVDLGGAQAQAEAPPSLD
jgi:hypothetical protein